MARVVRFKPDGQIFDAAGDTTAIPTGTSTEPKLSVEAAVLRAAQHLASTGSGERQRDMFGQEAALPTIELWPLVRLKLSTLTQCINGIMTRS
jgi:hypothetical protein